jgi:hypothetical protein
MTRVALLDSRERSGSFGSADFVQPQLALLAGEVMAIGHTFAKSTHRHGASLFASR